MKTTDKSDNEKCVQCGWFKKDHSGGFCYSHSEQDGDYFHHDRKFISESDLNGKQWHRSFTGKIIINSQSNG